MEFVGCQRYLKLIKGSVYNAILKTMHDLYKVKIISGNIFQAVRKLKFLNKKAKQQCNNNFYDKAANRLSRNEKELNRKENR